MKNTMETARPLSFALILISALATFSIDARALPEPRSNWLPKTSCRDAWGGVDQGRFLGGSDQNYERYRERLLKNGIDRRSCYKEWSVLVYMAANNDLAPYAMWDLFEMEGRFEHGDFAGSTIESDLLVEAETPTSGGPRTLHMFQRRDRPYRPALSVDAFRKGDFDSIHSPFVTRTGPATQSHSERFHRFLSWALREYPSKHTLVIVWGHGDGWSAPAAGSPSLAPSTTMPPKNSSGPAETDRLTAREISEGLARATRDVRGGSPIDLYITDACLMQTAEVSYELAPYARYIVGSAQVQSYLGLPYRKLLYEINSGRYRTSSRTLGSEDSALLMAKRIPPLMALSLDPIRGSQGRADSQAHETFTMSAVSSGHILREFRTAIQKFSKAMTLYIQEDSFRALDVAESMRTSPSFLGGGKDLGAFLGLLRLRIKTGGESTRATERLLFALDELLWSLDASMPARAFGSFYLKPDSPFYLLGYRAFGIWIPSSRSEFESRLQAFQSASLYRDTDWLDWISLVLTGASRSAHQIPASI